MALGPLHPICVRSPRREIQRAAASCFGCTSTARALRQLRHEGHGRRRGSLMARWYQRPPRTPHFLDIDNRNHSPRLQSNGDRDQPRPGAPRRQNGCRPAVTRSGRFWYEQSSAARSAQCDASTLLGRHREKGHIAAQLLQEPEPVPPRPRQQKGATWPPCESTEMLCLRITCMFDSRRNH